MKKSYLVKNLKARTATITFTKMDGTERVMRCTLIQSYLPPKTEIDEILEEAMPVKGNPQVLAVWDIEKNEWRSMRIERITNVEWDEEQLEA